jgi:hypothetical protein
MVAGMREMFAHDLAQRSNEKLKREYLDIDVREIAPDQSTEAAPSRFTRSPSSITMGIRPSRFV